MNTEWSDAYPAKGALKHEVGAMVDAVLAALLDELGEDAIRGVYYKGSSLREWDTLLDYVPELSDVDIHVWLNDDVVTSERTIDLETSLRIQAGIEHTYLETIPDPIHLPRPQLIPLNKLKQDIEYVPPPPGGVEVIFGEEMPADMPMSVADIVRIDVERLREDYDAITRLSLQVIDRPGRYNWTSLTRIAFRVSPTGPRVLDLLGMHPDRSWGMNRTDVVRALSEYGQDGLANKLTEYYVSAWKYFLSGYQDTNAARQTIHSGAETITIGWELAATYDLTVQ